MKKAIDILIDTSGSMRNPIDEQAGAASKFTAVISYITDVLPRIYEPSLHYGLCAFGSQVVGTPSPEDEKGYIQRLAAIRPRSLAELKDLIATLPPAIVNGAATPLADVILESIEQLKLCTVDHRAILIFSDGGDYGSKATMTDALAAAKDCLVTVGWNHFEIYSVGVGGLDQSLRAVSDATNGSALELRGNDAPAVQEVFTEIALRHLPPEKQLRRAAEITMRDVMLPAMSRIDAMMNDFSNEVKQLKLSLTSPNAVMQNAIASAQKSLETALTSLASSLGDQQRVAIERDRIQLRKLRNARRANFFLGLVNLIILLALAGLTAWIADGVFNLWGVVTELRRLRGG